MVLCFLLLFCWTFDPNSFMYWGLVYLAAISSLSSIFYVILENGFFLILFYFKGPHLIHLHYWILFEQMVCLYNIVESQIKHGFQSDDHNFCSVPASFGTFGNWESCDYLSNLLTHR